MSRKITGSESGQVKHPGDAHNESQPYCTSGGETSSTQHGLLRVHLHIY